MRNTSKNASNNTNSWEIALDFPDGSNFVSKELPVDPETVFKLSEEYLPLHNSDPDFKNRRLREKINIPFTLED